MPSSEFPSAMPSPCDSVSIISKSTIHPSGESTVQTDSIPLSVSDLPMLTCQYIQKGCLYSLPSDHDFFSRRLIPHLKLALSKTLSTFPALAGRLNTNPDTNQISILLTPPRGVTFIHASAPNLRLKDVLPTPTPSLSPDIPPIFHQFFVFTDSPPLSYEGHTLPITSIQVTELMDAFFIGVTVNHAVVDGTSLWNFFNSFAEISRSLLINTEEKQQQQQQISLTYPPCHNRDNLFKTDAVLQFPDGGPTLTFSGDEPVRERLFHFSHESISALKQKANEKNQLRCDKPTTSPPSVNGVTDSMEMLGKVSNDKWHPSGDINNDRTEEISSFQSLSALLWKCVTRARELPPTKTTTFRMAVNCRHRSNPKMNQFYFGNAIQSIPTTAVVSEVIEHDLNLIGDLLRRNVRAHGDKTVREWVSLWEKLPRCFPLGNFDGAMITMGSSPRFPMYENDFGWGRPVAVRSGKANKFDGKISAFPGREGDGSVDLEVVLKPETMACLEKDEEFMRYVSVDYRWL